MRDSVKILIMVSMAFLFLAIEGWLKGGVAVSGLLAVLAILIAAPLGAFGIDMTYKRLLADNSAD